MSQTNPIKRTAMTVFAALSLLLSHLAGAHGTEPHGPAAMPRVTTLQTAIGEFLIGRGTDPNGLNANGDSIIDGGDLGRLYTPRNAYRINCGGPAYTDQQGNVWSADEFFYNTGTAFASTNAIDGTDMDPLYQTHRFDPPGPIEMQYSAWAQPGLFRVRLHFAETTFTAPLQRVFNVYLENEKVFNGLDVFAIVGANKPLVLEYTTFSWDGAISVWFEHNIENPMISAIEIEEYFQRDTARTNLLRINCGGPGFTDVFGRDWLADRDFNTGSSFSTLANILGTNMSTLFQTERADTVAEPILRYAWGLSNPGRYALRLHFAEIFHNAPGQRVFDVKIEGRTVLENFDIFAIAGKNTAVSRDFEVDVTDGALELDFVHKVGDVKISGIELFEVAPFTVSAAPTLVSWPNTPVGTPAEVKTVTLSNTSPVTLDITSLSLDAQSGIGNDFSVTFNGARYQGGQASAVYGVFKRLFPGESTAVQVQYVPSIESDNVVNVRFGGNFAAAGFAMAGNSGGDGHGGHPYLHVVIDADNAVDFDGNGTEPVALNGEFSHTHELGKALAAFEWRNAAGDLIANTANAVVDLPVGNNRVSLTIFDNNSPPEQLTGFVNIIVATPSNVPGTLARYYLARDTPAEFMLDDLSIPDYGDRQDRFFMTSGGGTVGGSPYGLGVAVRLTGDVLLETAGTYEFEITGGDARKLLVNGAELSGPLTVVAGQRVALDARFAVTSYENLPLNVNYRPAGGDFRPIPGSIVSHDETTLEPIINRLSPTDGVAAGGTEITIEGIGFFPPDQVNVNWGGVILPRNSLTVTATQIKFPTPAGSGLTTVFVSTPNGNSDFEFFEYQEIGSVPVSFNVVTSYNMFDPTVAEWGPDGRLYVASLAGNIVAISYDDNYNVTGTQNITAIQPLWNNQILGIGFNPMDSGDPVRVYVAHSKLYANGGYCFTGFSPYSGQVSVLEGPNFNSVQPLITNLPVSNHDHAINALLFDNDGNLLIFSGGNTNAGVIGCNIGGLPESPLSGAILFAEIMKPGFNGAINYLDGNSNFQNDQVFGGGVTVQPGVDVRVYAPGFRNTFDGVFTTRGHLYALDNGTDPGFGDVSTGPNSSSPNVPDDPDELNFVEEGIYYGHPNRNRGRFNSIENFFKGPFDGPQAGFGQTMTTFPYSTNGLVEYRSNTFGGAMRGELIAQIWNSSTQRIVLTPDGRGVAQKKSFPALYALDVTTGPGGVVFGIDYSTDKVQIATPNEPNTGTIKVFDITPWRASTTGGRKFVIAGMNFGNIGNTSVQIGGINAALTRVSSNRIEGIIPARASAPADLLTVAVTTNGSTLFLPSAFRYIGNVQVDTGAAATIEIDPGSSLLASSTYLGNSFKLKNTSTGGQKIDRVVVDIRSSLLQDQAFDPYAQAGDPVGKDFTIDTNTVGGAISHTFDAGYEGGGFGILDIAFNSFDPNDFLGFSIDIDPISIKGAAQPGPNESGSMSGLELSCSTATFFFNDGTILVTHPWRKPGSLTGSKNTAKVSQPATPTIEVLGIPSVPATTNTAEQTVRITGPAGANVSLLICEAGLYLAGVPGGGFDIDPYEANNVIKVTELNWTLNAQGTADVPITLTKSDGSAGYNYIVAAVKDSTGDAGNPSQIIVLKYE